MAFMPLAGGDGAQARVFTAAVDDALELEHWLGHPPLIDPVDPGAGRRAAGRRVSRGLGANDAIRIARRLGAHYVVLTTLLEYDVRESAVGDSRANSVRRMPPTTSGQPGSAPPQTQACTLSYSHARSTNPA